MVQLYRSFNFFNITGYSLLDLCVFEWYTLWTRPESIESATIQDLQQFLEKDIPLGNISVAKQLVREEFSGEDPYNEFKPQMFCSHSHGIGSLRSAESFDPRPKGFITLFTTDMHSQDSKTGNVRFFLGS